MGFGTRRKKWLVALVLCVAVLMAHADEAEDGFWNSVVKGNVLEEYQLYVKQYPNGRYVKEARWRIEQLKKESGLQAEMRRLKMEQTKGTPRQKEESSPAKASKIDRYKPGGVFKDCSECPEMVVIPPGQFKMGSKVDDRANPVHAVRIGKPFALSKTEVTQGQWRAVMGNNPSQFTNCGDNCPVEKVSWEDIQEFLLKFNARTEKQYRLPTEAEWEYACRAGGSQTYCGNDSAGNVAWHVDNSDDKTHSVARKKTNAWGLYDMSGNVWEWTEDCWNQNYDGAPSDGSAWMSGNCFVRVVRGGSWNTFLQSVRSTSRSNYTTSFRDDNLGFRLAMTLK